MNPSGKILTIIMDNQCEEEGFSARIADFLAAQNTNPSLHLLLLDDGTNDFLSQSFLDLATTYPDCISLHFCSNLKLYSVYQMVVKFARGEFVWWYPRENFYTSIGVIAAKIQQSLNKNLILLNAPHDKFSFSQALNFNQIKLHQMVVKTKLLTTLGFFDPQLHYANSYHFWLKIITLYTFETLGDFPQSDESPTADFLMEKIWCLDWVLHHRWPTIQQENAIKDTIQHCFNDLIHQQHELSSTTLSPQMVWQVLQILRTYNLAAGKLALHFPLMQLGDISSDPQQHQKVITLEFG